MRARWVLRAHARARARDAAIRQSKLITTGKESPRDFVLSDGRTSIDRPGADLSRASITAPRFSLCLPVACPGYELRSRQCVGRQGKLRCVSASRMTSDKDRAHHSFSIEAAFARKENRTHGCFSRICAVQCFRILDGIPSRPYI